ncbi:hypothetical protein PGAAJM_06545 [Kocuria varians]
MRSSWEASATKRAIRSSDSCRSVRAAATLSSMPLRAWPTAPTSVAGSASRASTREASGSRSEPRSRRDTSVATSETRSRGLSARRMPQLPASHTRTTAIRETVATTASTEASGVVTCESGRPVMITSPLWPETTCTRYVPASSFSVRAVPSGESDCRVARSAAESSVTWPLASRTPLCTNVPESTRALSVPAAWPGASRGSGGGVARESWCCGEPPENAVARCEASASCRSSWSVRDVCTAR